jgi:hypothetical protein
MFLLHDFHDYFVIGSESSPPQFQRDPPIAIAAFMIMAYVLDRFPLFEMLFRLIEAIQVIE